MGWPADRLRTGQLSAVALLVFVVSFFVYHDTDNFAYYYHTDEPTKVAQLQTNTRNYFHPLLLLNTAGLIYDLEGRPPDAQRTVEAGRLASALFSAAALALVTVVAILHGGWVAGLFVSLAVLLDNSLYEFAHYFKEDPAMNFGLAVFCLGATLYECRPFRWSAVLLGVGCGLALSGKYIGIIALPFGLWVLLATRAGFPWRAALGWFFLGFVGSIAFVNWQLFFEAPNFLAGFRDEMSRVQDRFDESGTFQSKAWQRIALAFTPLTVLLLIVFLVSPFFRSKRQTVAQWAIFGVPAAFSLVLFFASRSGGRYNSPIILLSVLIAAIAAGWIASTIGAFLGRRSHLAQAACAVVYVVLIVGLEGKEFSDTWQNIRYDSRLELKHYIDQTLPPTAWIAEEFDANLSDPAVHDRFTSGMKTERRRWVTGYRQLLPDAFTIEKLRETGITHVVLVWSSDKKKIATMDPARWPKLDEQTRQRAIFYHRLTTDGKLLWECRGGSPDHVRPALRLYEVPAN